MKRIFGLITSIFIMAMSLCAIPSCGSQGLTCLSAPENFRLEGRTVVWDEVENAKGYIVCFRQDEIETLDACFPLPAEIEPGKYGVEVLAVGDDEIFDDSDWTEYLFEVEVPPQSDYDEQGLEYTLLKDGSGYEVSMGKYNKEGVLTIPDYFKGLPVKKISDFGFSSSHGEPFSEKYCNSLTTGINFPKYLEEIGTRGLACMVSVKELVLPETVTLLGPYAFFGCRRLEHIELSAGLKKISIGCFQYCSLKEIVFPEGLEEIGSSVFKSGTEKKFFDIYRHGELFIRQVEVTIETTIRSIVIPKSVRSIGDQAFYGCYDLEEFTFLPQGDLDLGYAFLNDTAWVKAQPDGYVTIRDDILYGYKGEVPPGASLTVPSGYRYYCDRLFFGVDSETTTSLKENLEEVIFPDDVPDSAVQCTSLSALKKVRLPADMEIMPDNAFSGCMNLKHIELPASLKKLGGNAFSQTAIEEISLPAGLEILGDSCFFSCPLTEIALPRGLKSIGTFCFGGAPIREILIPSSVEELGVGPFSEMTERVYYEGTAEQWDALAEVNNSPEKVWKPFYEIVIYTYLKEEPVEAGNYWRYVDGKPVAW